MEKDCTIYQTTNFIGKRWTLVILLELYKGNPKKRYSELKKQLPEITPKVLAERLRELESEGMVFKKIDSSVVPIRSDYSLTPSGIDFISIIKNIKKWALKWKVKNKVCAASNCAECIYHPST